MAHAFEYRRACVNAVRSACRYKASASCGLWANAGVIDLVGMARGALECFIEQAQRLKPFSLPYDTVADMASTQVVAAKAAAKLDAAQALLHRHAEAVDRAAIDGTSMSLQEESTVTMNSVYGATLCDEAVGMLQLCQGSSTVRDTNPIQRFVRDIRVANTHGAVRLEPTSEIHGRHLLGRPPFDMFAGGLGRTGRGSPDPESSPLRSMNS
jgi:alkylation response protein AidB-like acyl-CoA dehydrogenase